MVLMLSGFRIVSIFAGYASISETHLSMLVPGKKLMLELLVAKIPFKIGFTYLNFYLNR